MSKIPRWATEVFWTVLLLAAALVIGLMLGGRSDEMVGW